MTRWARIDVDIFRNSKVAPLLPSDQVAYIATILWCKEQGNGGVIAAGVPFRTFAAKAPGKVRQRLVDAELLIEEDGALLIPNFEKKQPLSDEERLKKDAERKRRERASAKEAAPNVQGHSADDSRIVPARAIATTRTKDQTALPENQKSTDRPPDPAAASEDADLGGISEQTDQTNQHGQATTLVGETDGLSVRERLDQLAASDFPAPLRPPVGRDFSTGEEPPTDDVELDWGPA